jgi:hypothetical protein
MYRLKQPNAYLEDVIDDYDYEALDWDDQEMYEPCNEDGGDEFLETVITVASLAASFIGDGDSSDVGSSFDSFDGFDGGDSGGAGAGGDW